MKLLWDNPYTPVAWLVQTAAILGDGFSLAEEALAPEREPELRQPPHGQPAEVTILHVLSRGARIF